MIEMEVFYDVVSELHGGSDSGSALEPDNALHAQALASSTSRSTGHDLACGADLPHDSLVRGTSAGSIARLD